MCDKCKEKQEYRDKLDEIGEDYCPDEHHYCIFKEFLASSRPSKRSLVQLACIDKLKFIKSQEQDDDIGWDTAFKAWIDEGHAERFAKAYDDKKSVKTIFNQTLGVNP